MISLLLAAACTGGVSGDLCTYVQEVSYVNYQESAGASYDIEKMVEVALQELDAKEETAVVEEVEPEPEVKEVNEHDLNLLAHLLYAEAGGSKHESKMMAYVGSVALNRVASDEFPDSLDGVVYQKGQYACVYDGNLNKEPNSTAYEIAERLLQNGSELPSNVVFQSEFTQGSGVYTRVDNMVFCYR